LIALKACMDKAQNSSGQLRSLGLPFGNNASDNDMGDVASIVARLAVGCAEPTPATSGGARPRGVRGCGQARPDAPGGGGAGAVSAALTVPPGGVFRVEVVVADWQGNRIKSGFDSGLVLQVET
jgi:hypothetical protein